MRKMARRKVPRTVPDRDWPAGRITADRELTVGAGGMPLCDGLGRVYRAIAREMLHVLGGLSRVGSRAFAAPFLGSASRSA